MPPLPSSPLSLWGNVPGLTSEATEVENSRSVRPWSWEPRAVQFVWIFIGRWGITGSPGVSRCGKRLVVWAGFRREPPNAQLENCKLEQVLVSMLKSTRLTLTHQPSGSQPWLHVRITWEHLNKHCDQDPIHNQWKQTWVWTPALPPHRSVFQKFCIWFQCTMRLKTTGLEIPHLLMSPILTAFCSWPYLLLHRQELQTPNCLLSNPCFLQPSFPGYAPSYMVVPRGLCLCSLKIRVSETAPPRLSSATSF